MTNLTTARLTLRPYAMDDFDAFKALLMSDRAAYMGGPFDLGGAWKFFTTDASAHTLSGYGCFTLWLGDTRIGFAGVIAPPDFPEPEMGWGLYDGYEGQGYATEAAAAILAHMFATTSRDSFVSYIDAGNAASIAVATRLGGTLDPHAVCVAGWTSQVYRHTRPSTGASSS